MRRLLTILALAVVVPACGTGGGGTLTPTVAPGTPTDLKAISGNGRVTLQWTAPSAAGFTVLRSANAAGPYFPISVPGQFPTPTSYVDRTVSNGNSYFYQVKAFNLLGESPPTTDVEGRPAFKPAVVAAGPTASHSLAVFEDGILWSWGWNNVGQLGTGTQSGTIMSPVEVVALDEITSASAGASHTIVLRSDGTVWGWGRNNLGQLGVGSLLPDPSLSPVQALGLKGMIAVAAGNGHALALRNDGTVWGWGDNTDGQAGDPATSGFVVVPQQVLPLTGITAVAAGTWHSMALKDDGTVWVWGQNAWGQLGNDNTSARSPAPVQVANLTSVIAIAAGSAHCLAVRNDGTVWAWGNNERGQLGNGIATSAPTRLPVMVSNLSGVTAASAGQSHSVAIRSDGSVVSWGSNSSLGVLGNGSMGGLSATPVPVSGLTQIRSISCGARHTMAQQTDGTVWAWGDNGVASLGVGVGFLLVRPVQCQNITPAVDADGGDLHTHALRSDGTVWSWGGNTLGQYGNGATSGAPNHLPVQALGLSQVTAMSSGLNHGLALRSDGTVWAWGSNTRGQVGNGNAAVNPVLGPIQVVNLTGNMTFIAAALTHSLAVRSDKTVWAWGENQSGELGNGVASASPVSSPVQAAITNVVAVAGGFGFSLALKSDGTVWGWGSNQLGQLGIGTTTAPPVLAPVQAINLSNIVAIAAGNHHALALRNDGTVWAWGNNQFGQIGTGTATPLEPVTTPFQVPTLTGITALSGGAHHSLALRNDGTVWSWGYNVFGMLGDDTVTDRGSPVQVVGLTGATAIAAGQQHSLAVIDGLLWAWGYNPFAQLGVPALPASAVPVAILD
jgi:alpha-tubulin suppressor-like RCC1 family protein